MKENAPYWEGGIGRRSVLALAAAALTAGCDPFAQPDRNAGLVTRIEVHKGDRRLYAFSGERKIKDYRVRLGFSPVGHKLREGDGRTPVGKYVVDRKNPQSLFHLSLGLSYPNRNDIRLAEARGVKPGGDIFIHGQPNKAKKPLNYDWTEGCIAVTNSEMRSLYRIVDIGTPVHIYH